MAIAKKNAHRSSKATRAADALQRLASELDAVTDAELRPINIDVVSAVTTALGVAPNLAKLKDSMEKLPHYDQRLVANLEAYAFAAYEAHAQYVAATRPSEALPALQERGTMLRDRLYADVQSLVLRDVIKAEEIRQVKTSNGYRALALDLTLLVDALQRRWEAVQGKTSAQLEELLEAEQLAEDLLLAVGERQQAPAAVADASAVRARAFTLLMRAYDEVRRGVLFLRHQEGDADTLAPSLYRGRGGPRPKGDAEEPAPSEPPSDGEPSTPPSDPSSPTQGGSTSGGPLLAG